MQCAVNRNDNCFNLIRLMAALQVFFGHACQHLNVPMPLWGQMLWGCFRGVPIFFLLSGFLLWGSLERNSDFGTYCKKRVLRLYPELWLGVLVNALVMLIAYGASIVLLPFLAHIFCQSTVLQFWTPESLRGYGCGTPNGSLWTIGVMVQCYLVFWLCYRLLRKRKLWVRLLALAVACACNFLPLLTEHILPETLHKLFLQTFLPYFWLFLAGGLMGAYFDRLIGLLKKLWPVFLACSVAVSLLGFESNVGAYELIKSLTLGLAMVGFAYRFPRLNIRTDLSYGFYIYHMIVINLMIHLGFAGNILCLAVALVLSLVLAVLSQLVIDRRRKGAKL